PLRGEGPARARDRARGRPGQVPGELGLKRRARPGRPAFATSRSDHAGIGPRHAGSDHRRNRWPPGARLVGVELNLTGKIAVVTGGSKGIGLAAARTLRAEGAHVVVASRKSSAELDALAGPGLVHVPADLTDPDAPAAVVAH